MALIKLLPKQEGKPFPFAVLGSGEKGVVHMIRGGDALKGLYSLGVAMGDEISSPEMIPKALRVIGIQAHRLFDPVDALVRPPKPGQYFPLLHDN